MAIDISSQSASRVTAAGPGGTATGTAAATTTTTGTAAMAATTGTAAGTASGTMTGGTGTMTGGAAGRPIVLGSSATSAGMSTSDCRDACMYQNDGKCDDGGAGSTGSACPLGSDCTDCGP